MQGYAIKTLNNDYLGTLQDFYFDDHDWIIRYLVLEMATTASNRLLLISPEAVEAANPADETLTINLTASQLQASPNIEMEGTLSPQQEAELRNYYGWAALDSPRGALLTGYQLLDSSSALEANDEATLSEGAEEDNHLQEAKKVLKYAVQARDGDAGHVEDFLIDDENWTLQYLVVDTGNWLSGRKVLVSPSYVYQIDWAEAIVHVDLNQETVKNSPEYDLENSPSQEFEEGVYDPQNSDKAWLRR
jgi:uncharacterized protein YrrD